MLDLPRNVAEMACNQRGFVDMVRRVRHHHDEMTTGKILSLTLLRINSFGSPEAFPYHVVSVGTKRCQHVFFKPCSSLQPAAQLQERARGPFLYHEAPVSTGVGVIIGQFIKLWKILFGILGTIRYKTLRVVALSFPL